jgi:hypothetical protein
MLFQTVLTIFLMSILLWTLYEEYCESYSLSPRRHDAPRRKHFERGDLGQELLIKTFEPKYFRQRQRKSAGVHCLNTSAN